MNVEAMATYNYMKFIEVVQRIVENLVSGLWFYSFWSTGENSEQPSYITCFVSAKTAP